MRPILHTGLRVSLLSVVAALLVSRACADDAVSYDYFYTRLAPYGAWLQLAGYGYAFQPSVSADWRPYTNGYWAWSDQGWIWISEEAWGWATCHYGRWLLLDGRGWVWIPGYEWAPAWVSWRVGNGYVGWAPLPPGVGWAGGSDIELGMSFGDVGPYCYNFCPVRYFGSGNMTNYVLPAQQNAAVIVNTQNITRLSRQPQAGEVVVYNQGPNIASIGRLAEHPVQNLKIERQNAPATATENAAPQNAVQGNVFRLNTPPIQPDSAGAAKPAQVAAKIAAPKVSDGYSQIADAQQQAAVRQRIRLEVAAKEREQEARGNAPFQIIQQKAAAVQRQADTSGLSQAQNATQQQQMNTQQQLQQLQQQQRMQQMQSTRNQTQIQNQLMSIQRLKQQAIEANVPSSQVQAIQQQNAVDQQLRQNNLNYLQQQNQNQLQQMQLQMQQQQRTIQQQVPSR